MVNLWFKDIATSEETNKEIAFSIKHRRIDQMMVGQYIFLISME